MSKAGQVKAVGTAYQVASWHHLAQWSVLCLPLPPRPAPLKIQSCLFLHRHYLMAGPSGVVATGKESRDSEVLLLQSIVP